MNLLPTVPGCVPGIVSLDPEGSGMNPTHNPSAAAIIDRADQPWLSCAEQALAVLIRRGRPFTASDLTELGVPDPDHSSRWGSLFAAAKARGDILPLGYGISRRPGRNSGYCRTWLGIPRAA